MSRRRTVQCKQPARALINPSKKRPARVPRPQWSSIFTFPSCSTWGRAPIRWWSVFMSFNRLVERRRSETTSQNKYVVDLVRGRTARSTKGNTHPSWDERVRRTGIGRAAINQKGPTTEFLPARRRLLWRRGEKIWLKLLKQTRWARCRRTADKKTVLVHLFCCPEPRSSDTV